MSQDEKGVIWAMGGRGSSNIAHAFISSSEFEKGHAICGRTLKPTLTINIDDIDNQELIDYMCPYCRGRLKLLKITKAIETRTKSEA